ncbi:hypothetical protein GSI_08988 [Ganoderma sinense ZZ0214-1]|uniref:Uncharacterized protein n=1 Tax=Ganoderma sinense ZZ0214-1 TaxID=1077348 RepID=A0A2G8S5A7_9APHY|nr:hypothetical protein GSI_08988 [Ganoderma sinense ZZ0214-1]
MALSSSFTILRDALQSGHLTSALVLRRIARKETLEHFSEQLTGWITLVRKVARDIRSRRTLLHGNRISPKVRDACVIALAQGYKYIWIDSCCIDKTSSAELSEAINSMYFWYREAAVCYAFLADVPFDDNPRATGSKFRTSRWFTRAWTLQELIAPQVVLFLSTDWRIIGSKSSLAAVVEEVSSVLRAVLRKQKAIEDVSVARRMSWAASRVSTRLEDRAYSLLGIFDINMPTLYGEGGHAFIRLQQEILKQIPDQSLFAWGSSFFQPLLPPSGNSSQLQPDVRRFSCEPELDPATSLFAHSPEQFREAASVQHVPYDAFLNFFGLTDLSLPIYDESPYGVRTQLPVIRLSDLFPSESFISQSHSNEWFLIPLACEHSGHLLGRICYTHQAGGASFASGLLSVSVGNPPQLGSGRGGIIALSPELIEHCSTKLHVKTIHMPLPRPMDKITMVVPPPPPSPGNDNMALCPWVPDVLAPQGYTIVGGPPCPEPDTGTLLLQHGVDSIAIAYRFDPERNAVQFAAGVNGNYIDAARGVNRPGVSDWLTWYLYARRVEFTPLQFRTVGGKDVILRIALERMFDHRQPLYVAIEVIDQETDGLALATSAVASSA